MNSIPRETAALSWWLQAPVVIVMGLKPYPIATVLGLIVGSPAIWLTRLDLPLLMFSSLVLYFFGAGIFHDFHFDSRPKIPTELSHLLLSFLWVTITILGIDIFLIIF